MKYNKFSVPNTLSISMIVKNESANLERCLKSLVPIADEIVIVDTGSTDNTVEIAKKFTDKVFFFKWVDDFAKARNFADSKCTKGWIFSMDGDEVLHEESHLGIKTAITKKNVIAFMVETYNYTNYDYYTNRLAQEPYNKDFKWCNSSYKVRLYQNIKNLYWEGKIHEQVLPSVRKLAEKDENLLSADGPYSIKIHHFGADEIRESKEKTNMHLEFGLEKLKTEKSFTAYYEIAALCEGIGRLEEAKNYYELAWEYKEPDTRKDLLDTARKAYKNTCLKLDLDPIDLETKEIDKDYIIANKINSDPKLADCNPRQKEFIFNMFKFERPTFPIKVTEKKVSVVVVTYGDKLETTKECVESLMSSLTKQDEIILIVNVPSPRLEAYLRSLVTEYDTNKYDLNTKYTLKVHVNVENIGWTAGCNQGAKQASHEYIVFSNYDVIYPDFWKIELLKYFDIPDIGAVGPVSDNINANSGQHIGLPFNWTTEKDTVKYISELMLKQYKNCSREVDSLVGYCMAVKKSAFEEVGGFDDKLFKDSVGFDDNDLSFSLLEKGYHLMVARDVIIYHNWQRTYDTQYREELDKYAKIFTKKWKRYFNPNFSVPKRKSDYPMHILISVGDIITMEQINNLYETTRCLAAMKIGVSLYISGIANDLLAAFTNMNVEMIMGIAALEEALSTRVYDVIYSYSAQGFTHVVEVARAYESHIPIVHFSFQNDYKQIPHPNRLGYVNTYITSSKNMKNHLINTRGIPDDNIHVIRYGLDLSQNIKHIVCPIRPLNIIVYLSGAEEDQTALNESKSIYEKFAEARNLNALFLGEDTTHAYYPEQLFRKADLVIGSDRVALMALGQGLNVIIANTHTCDGMIVNEDQLKVYMDNHFALQSTEKNLSVNKLKKELDKYDYKRNFSNQIRKNHNIKNTMVEILEVTKGVLKNGND